MHASPVSPSITGRELKRLLESPNPPFVLDVREPDEVAAWRMPGAVNVPLRQFLANPAVVPRDREVVAICAHGVRSARAAATLRAAGWTARNLVGGMVAWNSVYDEAEIDAGTASVVQLRRLGKGCLGYLVASGGEAVAIDPTRDVEAWIDAAARRGWRIVAALDTHAHADHLSGGRALAHAAGVEYIAPAEVGIAHRVVADGDSVRIGAASVGVVALPGHTPGGVAYRIGDVAIVGDTLFVDSVGRPDLGQDAAANAAVLWDTLRQRLLALPGGTRILPGHCGDIATLRPGVAVAATLDEVRARVAPLALGRDEFVAWVASTAGAKPGHFETIKGVNVGRYASPDPDDAAELEAGPNRCAV